MTEEEFKKKKAIWNKRYREKHKEQIKEINRVWQANNKDKVVKERQTYYQAHKEQIASAKEESAKALGFSSHYQRKRYNRWCNNNNIPVDCNSPKYRKKIKWWAENVDVVMRTKRKYLFDESQKRADIS